MTPAIETRGLTVAYGSRVAVDDLSVTMEPGTILAVLGPNGAGKTTLVRTLATLRRPSAGKAKVAGYDVWLAAGQVRRRIALSGQYSAVDADLTVTENLLLLARLTGVVDPGGRARQLEAELDLGDIAGRRVGQLSGGNQRRADLALSLIGQPEVLFLDEPTTGLDPAARQALWATVDGLSERGTSVLLTTQYLEEADQLADRVIVIDTGRVVADGSPAELKRQLGGPVLTIRPAPDQLDRLRHLTDSLAPVVRSTVDDESIALVVEHPSDAVEVLTSIDAAGVAVADVDLTNPTLDDVFFALTEGQPA